LDQHLDAGLPFVVAPAEPVVDAQDGIKVVEDLFPGQELADDVADHRRAAETAAYEDGEADGSVRSLDRMHADVVDQRDHTIGGRARYGDLELARKIGELGMEGGPLPQQFRVWPRIDDQPRHP